MIPAKNSRGSSQYTHVAIHVISNGRGLHEVIEDYIGTSTSDKGYAASITFQRAKEEGMQIAIHWQDGDWSGKFLAKLGVATFIIHRLFPGEGKEPGTHHMCMH